MQLSTLQTVVGVALVTILCVSPAQAATTYVYDFDNGQLTGSASPGTVLTTGTGTSGTLGQDNWVHTSGNGSSVVRNEVVPGFSGLWASAPIAAGNDNILTRKNDANFSYSIGTETRIYLSAKLRVDATSLGAGHVNNRAEIALGVDATNVDGKIRPTSLTTENAETAFIMGFDSTGPGWYLRQTAFGTATTVNAAVSGIWEAMADVDLAANSGNGAATLYVRQLFDDTGAAVSDTFHTVSASTTNLNLMIKNRMGGTVTGIGGNATAADPANWNGLLMRTSGNGAIDDITLTVGAVPEPASIGIAGLAAAACLRRRRAA